MSKTVAVPETAEITDLQEWEALSVGFLQLKGCSLEDFRGWKECELEEFLRCVHNRFRQLHLGGVQSSPKRKPSVSSPDQALVSTTTVTETVKEEEDDRTIAKEPKNTSCDRLSPMPVFRTFTELYQGMLTIAESAYNDLQTMSAAQRDNNVVLAESMFLKARSDCVRVVAVVQHVVDCKFDVSEFKCSDYKCNSLSHHIGTDFTVIPSLNEVPLAFKNRDWDEFALFQERPLDREGANRHTHLDYLCAKAVTLQTTFHMLLESCAQGIGIYHRGPLKPKLRCAAKVASDYAGSPRDYPIKPASVYLKDILRGTVVCPRVDDIRTGLKRLEGSLTGVKDRLQGPTHDVLVNLLFDGLVCEVQFHLADFYILKPFLHGPLEVMCAVHYEELLTEDGYLTLLPFEFE